MPNNLELAGKSPFLLRHTLVELAGRSERTELAILDASRGAANWQQPRVLNAWHALGLFASEACARAHDHGAVALALTPERANLSSFQRFARQHHHLPHIADGCDLLMRAWQWLEREGLRGWPADQIVYQFAEAMAGRRYPDPPTLQFVQPIISRYLAPLLFGGDARLAAQFLVFACEGATTGITQVTSTLAHNGIIRPGDRVAMWLPTYEPLIDLVECQLGCEIVPIRRDASSGWVASPQQLARLADPSLRLALLVSPGNPLPVVTDSASLEALRQACQANPDLLVLADYVYMHFVDAPVTTEIACLPRHTIGVYSFSKDFGLAGMRCGVVLLHEDSVAQRLLEGLDEPARGQAAYRYCRRSLQPEAMPLFERMVADSRGVSFEHMSGLSTPLQVLMCLCALYDLADPDAPAYFQWVRAELRRRLHALYEGLGQEIPAWAEGPNSRYSTVLDLGEVAQQVGGGGAAQALRQTDGWAFLQYLAARWRVVVTAGEGFGLGPWGVRVCFPAVEVDQARELGQRLAAAVAQWLHGGER